ncbi:MAG: lysophospholipid acyltransferase family protein [Bacteroidia bacterium]|nr:lysophospholipid acyltransferase family protein [Bacteroidia bacterium]
MKLEPAVTLDPTKATLMIGNHISWWDGFWPIEMNRRLWNRDYFVMMLESQLEIRPFLRRGGAFSIQPGHRSMIDSIRYAANLLADPQNLVLIFPQGRIHSQYDRSFEFAPGAEKILQKATKPVQVVFYAAFLDYGSTARPVLRMALTFWDQNSEESLASAYKSFFEEQERSQIHAVLSQHED